MNISITDHEVLVLKQALKSNIMAEGILKKIDSAEQMQEVKRNCEHQYGFYKSEKECCTKCGALDVGMGEEWKLEGYPIVPKSEKEER